MNDEQRIAQWKREEQVPFEGWDFAYLKERMIEESLPWDYVALAGEVMDRSTAVLDMATGGGERLLDMRNHWPETVCATEDYAPNLALARERLEPLGVAVKDAEATDFAPLPYDDHAFDLVLNRHAAINCVEVARVLRSGGVFLTQQVHGLNNADLQAEFGAEPQWPDATPERYAAQLNAAGLTVVDVRNWRGGLTFTDVGAIVYFLRAVPWLVPGFSVETHSETLLKLQAELEREGKLVYDARSYLVRALKPA